MKVGHIELFVRDPRASLQFYERLGCTAVDVPIGNTNIWITFGDIHILLRRGDPKISSTNYQGADFAIVLYTEDLDQQIAALTARGIQFSGNDGSSREPTFADPDGHWFQLVDPRDFM